MARLGQPSVCLSCAHRVGNDPEKTLLLVDGSSYLYRAFHALPELRSPKTASRPAPSTACSTCCASSRTDYKARRARLRVRRQGQDLPRRRVSASTRRTAQRDARRPRARRSSRCTRRCAALGWPVLVVDGVEADDVIGTLAEQAQARGLAHRHLHRRQGPDAARRRPRHAWINTMSNEKLDVEGVKQKFGVPPEQIVDYLTLIGDAIDNIPGVDKVGPEDRVQVARASTARSTGVIAHADEINGARRREPAQGARTGCPRRASCSRSSATCALPLDVRRRSPTCKPDRASAARSSTSATASRRWLKEVENAASAPPMRRARRRRPRSRQRSYAYDPRPRTS